MSKLVGVISEDAGLVIEKASGGLESTSIHSKGTIAVSIEPPR